MKGHTRAVSRRPGLLVAATVWMWAAACGGDVGGPSAGSGVGIDLSPYFSGAGRICDDEADAVTLTVTQTGPVRIRQESKPIPDNCLVTFDVEVDPGMVEFSVDVTGNGRPLLVGDTLQLIAAEGWVVEPRLDSVPALRVPVDTIGTAPTILDVVLTREADGKVDTLRIAVGDLLPDVVFALAAGRRTVELLGDKCEVQPRATVTVNIPVDPIDLPEAAYTVLDCPVGSISVTTSTTGTGGPADYTFEVGGSPQPVVAGRIATDTTIVVDEVLTGQRHVWLHSLGSCTVTSADTVTVTVSEGGTVPASFDVLCPGGMPADSGTIEVVTMTTGPGGPPSYSFSVDSKAPQTIGPNAMVQTPDTVGMHTVTLSGLGSCTVPDTTLDVTVTKNATVQAVFPVACAVQDTGAIEVVTTTMGSGGPPDYLYSLDSGTQQMIAIDTAIVIPGVPVGMHTVTLSGLGSCTVPDTTLDVTVTKNDTAQAVFTITCPSALGAIRISTHTTNPTGVDFEFKVVPGPADTIGQNSTRLVTDLPAGSYSVRLLDVDPCVMLSQNPQSVDVAGGDTVTVIFEVDCSVLNEPPGASSSLIESGLPSRAPLLDLRRRRWYAARASEEGPTWTM